MLTKVIFKEDPKNGLVRVVPKVAGVSGVYTSESPVKNVLKKKKIEWVIMFLQDIIIRREKKRWSLIKAKCKFEMDISKRLYAWSLPHILDGNGYVKMCLNESLPYWVWVSSLWVFIKQEQEYAIKKGVPTWEGQDRHHLAQVGRARQRYDLDRFSLLPVSWWWWETGFRIDNRTIKRGSRSEYLDRIVQRELKPLHTCHHIFLDSYLAFIHVRI